MGFREHTLFWSACALAVASFAYGTYVLIAWSPAFASPSDLPLGGLLHSASMPLVYCRYLWCSSPSRTDRRVRSAGL